MTDFSRWLLRDEMIRTAANRATHTHVIGQPGTGKSRALESWIMQDIQAGRGVGVVDPHGDLYRNLLVRLSILPNIWPHVILLDPTSQDWVTAINPLEAASSESQERLALFLTDIIGKIWRLDTASAPRTMWLLSNTFLALANLNLSMLHLPRFLLDKEYRSGLLTRLTNPSAHAFFQYEYPQSLAASHQWASPVLNKIGSLIFDPDVSLMLAGRPRIRFREIMDRQLIVLVNLPKGTIGEGVSALMGAFIVAQIQKAALARANSNSRIPFYLYLDEFQNYTADNIRDILSESRKYSLSMILANQYLDQLSPEIREALLNTAGSIVSFRVGHQDAAILAKEIFPGRDFPADGRMPALPLPRFGGSRSWLGSGGEQGWEGLMQELTGLHFREFWLKQRGERFPVKQRTLDMDLPLLTPQIREQVHGLVATSGRLYGRPKAALREEVAANRLGAYGFGSNPAGPSDGDDTQPPFWGPGREDW